MLTMLTMACASEPAPTASTADIPAGWETITTDDLEVAVPPGWRIERRDVAAGGPCVSDLYQGDSTVTVYTEPVTGACRAVDFVGRPRVANLVIFPAMLDADDEPGIDRRFAERHGHRITIGQIEAWRVEGGAPAEVVPEA